MRSAEIAKYAVAYRDDSYRMGEERRAAVTRLLSGGSGSLLDVGTGRGETLAIARACGYDHAIGTEVVPELLREDVVYAEAHALPFEDSTFDVVTCFDVLEHLLLPDQEAALLECCRVARRQVIVTAADYSHEVHGVELHVGRRSYDQWDALISLFGPTERLGWCGSAMGWRVRMSNGNRR